MTVAGANALEVELLRLKDDERPRIVNDIATAREHGDLKENAEYHAAKDEQGFIERRIQEIESKLSRMQLIDVTQLNQDGRCVFCLLYTSPSPRDATLSRMPSSA